MPCINTQCPCCLEEFSSNCQTIEPFTDDNCHTIHGNGQVLNLWYSIKSNDIIYFILRVGRELILPFYHEEVVNTFNLRQEFIEAISYNPLYLDNVTYRFNGKCNHSLCMKCYYTVTENKCPICRHEGFLSPVPLKCQTIGRIQWEDNYPLESFDRDSFIEGTPILNEFDTIPPLLDTSAIRRLSFHSEETPEVSDAVSEVITPARYNALLLCREMITTIRRVHERLTADELDRITHLIYYCDHLIHDRQINSEFLNVD